VGHPRVCRAEPLNNEGLSTYTRQEFCLALKGARERKGITLTEIANATKIPAYLFAGLERNDLRRWPKGLFRRSFFRDYVRMIGLPVAETCAEFVLLFPDEAAAELTKSANAASEPDRVEEVRLALDPAWHGPRASVLSKILAAAIDAGVVILLASALAWVAGMDRPATIAIVALAYFSLATVLFGESPAKWAIVRRHLIFDAMTRGFTAIPTASRSGVAAISSVFGNAEDGTPQPVEEPEVRAWVTDAHRVGPSSRLRVRIKMSQ
jgi:hypothetical protein